MPNKPVVASYVANFLKLDQLHVYRQLQGIIRLVDAHVFTHRRENADQFPYMEKWVYELRKSRLRWWRRFVHKQLRQEPWQMYRWELREMLLGLARIDAQLLHIYFGNVAPQFLPLLKVWPHPTVVSFHGADAAVDMDKPRYRAAMQEVFKWVTKVQARSTALANDLLALGCPGEKIVIHRTGIPLAQWPYLERQAPADGAWHLVQSCRFIEKKGLDLTLQTFASLRVKYPKARLSLIGDGPLLPALQQQAQALGISDGVTFSGFLPQVALRPILESAHIYLQPSRTGADGNREGVPNAMLEAMASGMAVVASRHGGIPEAVTDNVNGLLVNEDDSSALFDATLRVITEPELAKRLGEQASATVSKEYRRESQDEKLAAFYEHLIAERNL